MRNTLKVITGMVVLALLITSAYVYAGKDCCGDHPAKSEHPDHAKAPEAESKSTPIEDLDSPKGMLKTADEILKEAAKAKPPKANYALMAHCEKMLAKAMELVGKANLSLESDQPDMAVVAESIATASKLMKKSAELSDKYLALLPVVSPPARGMEQPVVTQKPVYTCPMGCETSDKPGKCSKCGMNLAEKKDKASPVKAAYACPMNCETSDKPGKCSKCGMNLEKKN